jgi:hypothetical protein
MPELDGSAAQKDAFIWAQQRTVKQAADSHRIPREQLADYIKTVFLYTRLFAAFGQPVDLADAVPLPVFRTGATILGAKLGAMDSKIAFRKLDHDKGTAVLTDIYEWYFARKGMALEQPKKPKPRNKDIRKQVH